MKRTVILLSALSALTACSTKPQNEAQNEAQTSHSLVLYYSQNGATRQVAELLAQKTNADIDSIVAEQPYDGSFSETIARCQQEMQEGTVPSLKALTRNVADYDTIYLGFPVWFGTYAPPVAALVAQQTFEGKVLIPFCTFGSGGLESSTNNLKAALPTADIQTGYGVRNARVAAASAELDEFLIRSGIIEGEVEELDAFSEQEAVSDATQVIYDAACGSYPMPLGTPVAVCSRKTATGTEYLYIVESKGPDGNVSDGRIYVFLSDQEEAVPEFIKAVR